MGAQNEVFGYLLRNGAPPGNDSPHNQVLIKGPHNAFSVHATVLVEPPVLHRYEGVYNVKRYAVEVDKRPSLKPGLRYQLSLG